MPEFKSDDVTIAEIAAWVNDNGGQIETRADGPVVDGARIGVWYVQTRDGEIALAEGDTVEMENPGRFFVIKAEPTEAPAVKPKRDKA